ncbi:phosphate ABC transporter substrate-binding protein, PhoT family [Arboricoccus pini]|uniref:Phosphate-binding protein PstS n=1 Tax=Arboricoccus pini TaxID=1963835 RepID=A0A212QPE3_9PROT|nr:phosphate ABC transporter substrate-binding protein PstS [Arboricoccus pini]SNB61300.1 phosphate ABC transporter substrate-binding protein, PhoT family [Arboricoccus pini]
MRTLSGALAGALLTISAGLAQATDISGAGATFPYPVYAKWAEAYKAETGVGMNYQSIGSGGGIKQIIARTVTFGASDAPMKSEDLEKNGLVQWPQIMGGAVPAVNLPGIQPGGITLDGHTIAEIYLGNITSWNDPQIAALNKGVNLPDIAIAPVYRSDGSGTNFLFTTFLSQTDDAFAKNVGANASVQWPAGIGAKGNEGVANMVRQTQGSIGYVEYAYVKQNKMTFAKLMNSAGKAVEPDSKAFAAAAANADWKSAPGYYLILTNQPGADSWPITGASFILMPKEPKDPAAAKAAISFFRWAFEKGGALADGLDYVPMPPAVVKSVEELWQGSIKVN